MRIIIPGPPVAKARPRFCRRGKFVTVYHHQDDIIRSERAKLIDAFLELSLEQNEIEAIYSLPLHVDLEFHLPVANSATDTKRRAKLWGLETHKPDLDNLVKFLDIANGILWRDDSQIAILNARKLYSENPCTIIEINPIQIPMDIDTKKITALFSPDDMDEFYCHLQIVANAISEMRSAIEDEKLLFMPDIARKIIDFSTNYVPKLKKLVKKDGK